MPAQRSESSSGFHFMNLYQCCPRKFYFRYLKGWRSQFTDRPLIQGSAFHEGKAEYYKTGKLSEAKKIALEVTREAKEEIVDDATYRDILFRVPILLEKWVEAFGAYDLDAYEIVAVEKEFKVPLLDTGYMLTIRPDTILKSKAEDFILVMETKTSGFSHRVTGEAVYYGDQATSYLFGVRKMGIEAYAVQPDIAYWNSRTQDTGNIQMIRSDLVFRSGEQCASFEKSVAQIFTEISQKVQAYRERVDPWLLFPRNSHYCLSFSTPCKMANICMQNCEKKGVRVPDGFKKQGGVRKIGSYIHDELALANGG